MKVYVRDRNGLVHVPQIATVPDHPWTQMGCGHKLEFVPGKYTYSQDMRELLCNRVDNGTLTCIGCIAWELFIMEVR